MEPTFYERIRLDGRSRFSIVLSDEHGSPITVEINQWDYPVQREPTYTWYGVLIPDPEPPKQQHVIIVFPLPKGDYRRHIQLGLRSCHTLESATKAIQENYRLYDGRWYWKEDYDEMMEDLLEKQAITDDAIRWEVLKSQGVLHGQTLQEYIFAQERGVKRV
jgi:hypothetical protein